MNRFMVPGKESDGADVNAFVYSKPVVRSFAIVLLGLLATYLGTSLPWNPSILKAATCS